MHIRMIMNKMKAEDNIKNINQNQNEQLVCCVTENDFRIFSTY